MMPEHYVRGRAPAVGTRIAIAYLREYTDRFTNKAEAAEHLLGCSKRTAKRLLSRRTPYTARIKVDWAYRICAAIGRPVGDILGRKGVRLFPYVRLGWTASKTRPEAVEKAAECASSISMGALLHYGLYGKFSVSYENGWVSAVTIYLSSIPNLTVYGGEFGYHRIILTSTANKQGVEHMWMQYINPLDPQGKDGKLLLTQEILELTLHEIYAFTKDYTADLQRESLHEQASKRGRLDKRIRGRHKKGGLQRTPD